MVSPLGIGDHQERRLVNARPADSRRGTSYRSSGGHGRRSRGHRSHQDGRHPAQGPHYFSPWSGPRRPACPLPCGTTLSPGPPSTRDGPVTSSLPSVTTAASLARSFRVDGDLRTRFTEHYLELLGLAVTSVPSPRATSHLFTVPETLYRAPSPEKQPLSKRRQSCECHSGGTFRRVRYSVLGSKKAT